MVAQGIPQENYLKVKEENAETYGQSECKGFQGDNSLKVTCENVITGGQSECRYYLLPGGCRFGNSCRFAHCREDTDVGQIAPNFTKLLAIQDGKANTSSASRSNIDNACKQEDDVPQKQNLEEKSETKARSFRSYSRPLEGSRVTVNPVGLPLRPDQPICIFYRQYRLCKYGIGCQYNHPVIRRSSKSAKKKSSKEAQVAASEEGK